MQIFHYSEGRVPLLVSMPHCGTRLPERLATRMTTHALRLPDTDWHVDRLYDFADALGAAILRPVYSRYVIDLNRAPDGAALYPGASNTELCPITTFDEQPLYRDGQAPDAGEVAERRTLYWQPYHERLREALADIRARHGLALLYDAHSIRSRVPRFFAGELPHLNLGTAGGASCDPELQARLAAVLREAPGYTHAVNGRFKGGYITRASGNPAENVHAVQMELSQVTYMDEDYPFNYREDLAARIRPALGQVLEEMLRWAAERRSAAGR